MCICFLSNLGFVELVKSYFQMKINYGLGIREFPEFRGNPFEYAWWFGLYFEEIEKRTSNS
jgi:hypothetical protein